MLWSSPQINSNNKFVYYFSFFTLSNCTVFLLFLIIYNLPCKVMPIVDIVLCWRPDCHLIRLSCVLDLFPGDARRSTSWIHLILPPSPVSATSRNQMSLLNIHPGFFFFFLADSRARRAAGLPLRWCPSPVSAGGVRASRPSRSGPPRMDFTIL